MFNEASNQKILGKYIVLRTLGSGMFKVKLIYDPVSGTQYAAKVCKQSLRKAFLEKEAALIRELSKVNIPNVIKYIDYIDNPDGFLKMNYQLDCNNLQKTPEYNFRAALILELAANETLFDIIYHNGKLEEKLARTYFKKLIEAVAILHSKGIVHRDLKPENILLDDNFQLKLSDFGFARDFNDYNKTRMMTKLGTESYMAPEMHTSRLYSGIKIDSFACGVLLFLLVFGRPPFYKAWINDQLYSNFIQEKPEKFWTVYEEKMNNNQEFDQGLKSLISDLLKYNPEERLDVDKIYGHEWINRDVYNDEELIKVMKPLREITEQMKKKSKK